MPAGEGKEETGGIEEEWLLTEQGPACAEPAIRVDLASGDVAVVAPSGASVLVSSSGAGTNFYVEATLEPEELCLLWLALKRLNPAAAARAEERARKIIDKVLGVVPVGQED